MKRIKFRIQRSNNLNDVYVEDVAGSGNGRYHYKVIKAYTEDVLLDIHFQEGASRELNTINGVVEADLLEIVRSRLQYWQEGEYRARENACAITHIEEALMWIAKRADDRAERGVLGRDIK